MVRWRSRRARPLLVFFNWSARALKRRWTSSERFRTRAASQQDKGRRALRGNSTGQFLWKRRLPPLSKHYMIEEHLWLGLDVRRKNIPPLYELQCNIPIVSLD